MSEKAISQRKRLAMGDQPRKYAVGGMVTPRNPAGAGTITRTMLPPPPVVMPRGPLNPVTMAKRMNGIPGMKKGGKVKR